ncbi:MAG: hypothetical protein JSV16_13590 [Candidatus Hydrogenedentota bacterium]|nr:MAG: hypothetical protein JSV16_13590 [Candidatus Hydrogenedentota bacterium]
MVRGSRLFHITVTSYKSASYEISPPNFYVLSSNGVRSNPRPHEGYRELKATLGLKETASGHVSFPTSTELKTMVIRSDLADFELDLETGEFDAEPGLF